MALMPTITCPANCTTNNLPIINFQACNPQILSSELQELFLGRPDAVAFSDITSATAWNDRISVNNTPPVGSTVVAKDLLRRLTIIGDVPAPTSTKKQISGGREITTETKYAVNVEIDDLSDENWQFVQTLQCGKGAFPAKAWLVTKSGHVIGGNAGIDVTIDINFILDRGADGIQRAVGVLTFVATIFPNRDVFPLA